LEFHDVSRDLERLRGHHGKNILKVDENLSHKRREVIKVAYI
jgi:hypothetical protein